MQYGLTAKTITRAKLKSVPAGTETDWRFVWEVNYATICGKKLLIVVHADTRYSMIYCDIKPVVWKNLKDFLHDCVIDALKREGFTHTEIEKYFSLAGEEIITKTHGRKATGGMIHLTEYLSYYEKVLTEGMFQPLITDTANRDLCSIATHPEEKYIYPNKFFVERMKKLLCDNQSGIGTEQHRTSNR